MDYSELYYEQTFGCYPFSTDEPRKETERYIQCLKDNGFSNDEIIKAINYFSQHGEASISSNSIQNYQKRFSERGNLIEPGRYYYHSLLHITPPAPTFDPNTGQTKVYPFFEEMVMQFTREDLISHIYLSLNIPTEFTDHSKDNGAIEFLLNKYNNLQMSALDFILYAVDIMAMKGERASKILDITNVEIETLEEVNRIYLNSAHKRTSGIVWR